MNGFGASLLQAAREQIRRMPDMDAEKVAKIKAQLKNGTYHVDGNRIASKMLAESLLKEIDEQ